MLLRMSSIELWGGPISGLQCMSFQPFSPLFSPERKGTERFHSQLTAPQPYATGHGQRWHNPISNQSFGRFQVFFVFLVFLDAQGLKSQTLRPY